MYQEPGAVENLKEVYPFRRIKGSGLDATKFVEDAGHWVQQEQPEKVARLIRGLLNQVGLELEAQAAHIGLLASISRLRAYLRAKSHHK